MAKARALDKRRKSIRNMRKITRTMELIATAQFKKPMDRALAAGAYTDRIASLVGDLARAGLEVSHPLLESREETKNATLLVLTANRGMCGGFNGGVLRQATARWKQLQEESDATRLEVSGKKGIAAMRFRGMEPAATFDQFEHKPTFDEVEVLANGFLEAYQTGKLDRLDVAYTRFDSLARQTAVVQTLLPLTELAETDDEEEEQAGQSQYDFLPSARSILDEVVPTSFKVKLFKCFLDSGVSEQVARMVAMKAATENADSIIDNLTMTYNRARQSQITSEILEVISGAEALK